jgi:hypothetical protein
MSDELLTTLIDTICDCKWYSTRVMYDKFQEKYNLLLEEYKNIYTENELNKIKKTVEEYDFITLINSFHQEYEENY